MTPHEVLAILLFMLLSHLTIIFACSICEWIRILHDSMSGQFHTATYLPIVLHYELYNYTNVTYIMGASLDKLRNDIFLRDAKSHVYVFAYVCMCVLITLVVKSPGKFQSII